MSRRMKILVMTAAVLLTAAAGSHGQVRQTGSPIADLLALGKRELNDFNYRKADTVAHQLLALPLSRQQRIDALQLLVAVMFPDDAAEQRRDSAAAVMRQLVGMGVTRMVTADLSWPGLDSLYASIAAEAPAVGVAGARTSIVAGYDSVPSVIALVSEGRQLSDIVERVNLDCYAFAFDELDSALRGIRAPNGLSDALKRTCSRLLVETDPPDATLTVGARNLGTVPDRGQLRWVQPEKNVEVSVQRGAYKSAKAVEFPRGRLLQAKFFLPRDTLPWPGTRSSVQIAEDLKLFDRWTPSTPRPVQPVRPRRMNAFGYGMIWGLLGAGGGYAVAQFVPSVGCVSMNTVPQGEIWRVRGKRYNGGESVNLGEGMPCVATIAGGSGLGMMMLTSIIKSSSNRGARRRYEEAVRAYPTVVKEWEERERRTFAERNADVRQTLADQQIRLAQVQSENNGIRARNAQLPEPQIFERELSFANTFTASTSTAEIMSDIDLRVPVAAAPDSDAVAVVIGNRDYQGRGVPKVDFAIRDAKTMKRYLVEAFGFREDRVLLDTNVTYGRMSELLGSASDASSSRLSELVSTRAEGTVDVFVFYSGLGAPDGRPAKKFLLPVDAAAQRIRATGYSLDQLYKNLTGLKARSVTVAIEAGFGPLASDMFATESFGGIEVEVGTVGGANTQVFTAGTGDQQARWRRDQGHGLFSYFLLKGLQGYADANTDGAVTAGELENYVKSNVRTYAVERLSGVVQVPEVFTNNPDRVVVKLKPGM